MIQSPTDITGLGTAKEYLGLSDSPSSVENEVVINAFEQEVSGIDPVNDKEEYLTAILAREALILDSITESRIIMKLIRDNTGPSDFETLHEVIEFMEVAVPPKERKDWYQSGLDNTYETTLERLEELENRSSSPISERNITALKVAYIALTREDLEEAKEWVLGNQN